MAQVGDRGFGNVAFHLTEPAHRAAQGISHIREGQPAAFTQGAQISAKGVRSVWVAMLHLESVKILP
jgi:hypothetical protein